MLAGSFVVLFFYDICEEIRLEALRGMLKAPPAGREPAFRHPSPEYVRFEKPPVIVPVDEIVLPAGERFLGRLAYYEYGIISIELTLAFALGWEELSVAAARWMEDPALEKAAGAVVRAHAERVAAVLVKPYTERLSEDYSIIHVHPLVKADGAPVTAAELLETRGGEIARLVRGETGALSASEQAEILAGRISYSPLDLLVAAWTAAFIYDTAEDAAPTRQLLEYANTQLLEFRHYDAVLTNLLEGIQSSLAKGTGMLGPWRMARAAGQVNTILLEVRGLTERVDNSLKFLSDMFSARLYRLAEARIGVPDYRRLVDEKLATAGALYGYMTDRYHQGRAFVLELMVVIILMIELVYFFRDRG